jgi:hypothetical protein
MALVVTVPLFVEVTVDLPPEGLPDPSSRPSTAGTIANVVSYSHARQA